MSPKNPVQELPWKFLDLIHFILLLSRRDVLALQTGNNGNWDLDSEGFRLSLLPLATLDHVYYLQLSIFVCLFVFTEKNQTLNYYPKPFIHDG